MEFEVTSAASLVPRIGEQLTQSLRGLKDRFMFEGSTAVDQPAISPIFQSVHEGCPTDVITFHHQEEVVATNDSRLDTFFPMDDLNSLEANDLFSCFLDEKSANGSIKFDSLTPCFDAPASAIPCPDIPFDLDIPSSVLDLIDSSLAESPEQKSNSSLSSDCLHLGLHDINKTCYYSEAEGDAYFCEDEDIERGMPSRRRDRGRNLYDLPLCLHNEDLVGGKPGQRLVLMAEEKRLLVQMGQRVPTTFPLTRSEERAIRIMRRKIRNKLSAKASRARRQEYLSNLESQMEDCHKENQRLRYRITELEEDKRGLLANLRKMRSYMARLISSSCSPKVTRLKSVTSKLPLLPLTVSHQNHRQQQQRLGMNSGKPASLMLLAFLILASAATLPLPSLDASDSSKDVSSVDPNVLSGRSRVLLNRETEVDYTLDRKSETSLSAPITAISKLDDPDDDIPTIKTKIHSLNKEASRVLVQPVKEEQIDPFLLPMTMKTESELAAQVKKGPDIKLLERLSLPYSMDYL